MQSDMEWLGRIDLIRKDAWAERFGKSLMQNTFCFNWSAGRGGEGGRAVSEASLGGYVQELGLYLSK